MKKLNKAWGVIIALCFMIETMVGCTTGGKNDKFYNEADSIQAVDGAGRSVSFPEPAKTVATNWGGTVDPFLFALGMSDSIVAQNSKKRGIIDAMLPNYDNIPSIGAWSLDTEALAKVSADVYIHSYTETKAFQSANKVGVRAIGIKTEGYDDIMFNLQMLGKVFGVEERADAVIAYYESILDIVRENTKDIPEDQKKTVVIFGGDAGKVCRTSFEIELAGGINCADKLNANGTDRWPEAGTETILSWNPDFIFPQNKYAAWNAKTILSDPAWKNANVVVNGNIYDIPCPFESWININMSDCLAVLFMSMKMYPEAYADVDFEQVVVDYYQFVYGLNVDWAFLNQDVN